MIAAHASPGPPTWRERPRAMRSSFAASSWSLSLRLSANAGPPPIES